MTLEQIGQVAGQVAVAASAVVGALYATASGLATVLPQNWRITHAFARWAADLREVREVKAQDRPMPKDPIA